MYFRILILFTSCIFFSLNVAAETNQILEDWIERQNNSARPTPAPVQMSAGSQSATPADSLQKQLTGESEPTLREKAFKQLLQNTFPLTPEQIMILKEELDKSQRAVATNVNGWPTPVSSTVPIDISPGSTPPLIRLAAGFISTIIFVDSTGNPWPIADYSLGNPKSFNIQWDKKTNALFIQSLTVHATGNMAIRLHKLDTPIVLSLVSGQKFIDYRVDFQLDKLGPNAPPVMIDMPNLPDKPNALIEVLDGVPPKNSTQLKFTGGGGKAWLLPNGSMVVRTKLLVLSPGWTSKVTSADGTNVYEIPATPLLVATDNGKTVNIHIEGF